MIVTILNKLRSLGKGTSEKKVPETFWLLLVKWILIYPCYSFEVRLVIRGLTSRCVS
jgi:hypothetical protein